MEEGRRERKGRGRREKEGGGEGGRKGERERERGMYSLKAVFELVSG